MRLFWLLSLDEKTRVWTLDTVVITVHAFPSLVSAVSHVSRLESDVPCCNLLDCFYLCQQFHLPLFGQCTLRSRRSRSMHTGKFGFGAYSATFHATLDTVIGRAHASPSFASPCVMRLAVRPQDSPLSLSMFATHRAEHCCTCREVRGIHGCADGIVIWLPLWYYWFIPPSSISCDSKNTLAAASHDHHTKPPVATALSCVEHNCEHLQNEAACMKRNLDRLPFSRIFR